MVYVTVEAPPKSTPDYFRSDKLLYHSFNAYLGLVQRGRDRHARGTMERTISASTTLFFKYLFPAVWIGGFGLGALKLLFQPQDVLFNGVRGAATPANQLFTLVVWVFGSAFILWFSAPLKRVRLRADGLSVSNYWREVLIPFGAIERVTQNLLVSGRPISIHFRYETPFGRRIKFMPAGLGIFTFWKEDKVVKELRQCARRAKPILRAQHK